MVAATKAPQTNILAIRGSVPHELSGLVDLSLDCRLEHPKPIPSQA